MLSSLIALTIVESQNIVQIDLSSAEKVAEFDRELRNPVHKRNGFFETLVGIGEEIILYRSPDSLFSEWEKFVIQDTVQINHIYFINNQWIGAKQIDRADISGNTYLRVAGYSFYILNFDTGEIVFNATEGRQCTSTWPSPCNVSGKLSQNDDHLLIQFERDWITQTISSIDEGISWGPIPNDAFIWSNRQTNVQQMFSRSTDSVTLVIDNQFLDAKRFALPDAAKNWHLSSAVDFQDTLRLISASGDQFTSIDNGLSWIQDRIPINDFNSVRFENETYYFVSNDELYRTDAHLNNLTLISQISGLNLNGSQLKIQYLKDDELIIDLGPKGLYQSFNKGNTWQQLSTEGLPKSGFYRLMAHKNRMYGKGLKGGYLVSEDGENWTPSLHNDAGRILATDSFVYAAYDPSDTVLIFRSSDNINWDTCQYFKAEKAGSIWPSTDFFNIGEQLFISGTYAYYKNLETCSNSDFFDVNPDFPEPIRLSSSATAYSGDSIAYSTNWQLIRSLDFGQTFDTVSLPADFLTLESLGNRLVGSSYSGIWGTGFLYLSDDWGLTWRRISSLPNPYFRYLYFKKKNFLFQDLRDGTYVISPDGEHFIELINNPGESVSNFEFFDGFFYFTDQSSGLYRIDDTEIMEILDRANNTVDVNTIQDYLLDVNIYPNPVSDILTIKIEGINSELLEVNLLNHLGQIISKHQINSLSKTHQIETDKVPKGMFFVNLKFSDGRHSIKKVIKD